jgi:hypothetical protein
LENIDGLIGKKEKSMKEKPFSLYPFPTLEV